MGRDSISVCDTCRVWQDNGDGSNLTWMDHHYTVEAFDAHAATLERGDDGKTMADREKNQNVRAFLVRHAGHEIRHQSSDWVYDENDTPPAGYRRETAAGGRDMRKMEMTAIAVFSQAFGRWLARKSDPAE